MFDKFLDRLFFTVDDESKNLKLSFDRYISEIHDDLQKLKSIDLQEVPIFYTNKNISIKFSSDFVDSEHNNVDELKSIVKSCVFANIIQKEK